MFIKLQNELLIANEIITMMLFFVYFTNGKLFHKLLKLPVT